MKTYKSSGIVLGNFWGGGSGSYPAKKFEATTRKGLIETNMEALADKSLDSGMGYESLIGAFIEIKTVHTIKVKGKLFTNVESELETIGELTEKQKDFLENCYFCL